ncbi:MAG: ShlB/FhaC/HecB family hemolysin secretion/activation protein [Verrucomicrobia bacterium]|nr:MAG: ShlB/FhaC/HecB family hemolysin secretion/activation protein [Verrucomicrobiota bacterium]TAE87787.1 MAG: ShlB/FhaC/HecB family hemolysin secretion/activation protein [Verrucomicrobiota bacterium]TAF25530.1 MAG: ShlB/FhaC/HecB family hemolysin secretion/activation protein [Verrucomicrobiota bacterium]TAF41403.1 MAG: ShlB/FhaC/HecB family hemolysin secretion/activation protein [Verrucomicrobiota bacterium]
MRRFLPIFLVASAGGQLLPEVGPRLPDVPLVDSLPRVRESAVGVEKSAVIVARLERIRLLPPEGGGESEVLPGISVGRTLPLPAPKVLAARLVGRLGRPLTEGGLSALADEILIHYDKQGFPMVSLAVGEQEASDGALRLTIAIGRYGEVGVARPKFGDPESVRTGLRLRRGDQVRRADLDEQLAWYGRRVFRRPRLFVSPGVEADRADLLIAFEESRPWRVTSGYENSGPDVLGRERLLLGFAGMNAREHFFAWQGLAGLPASSLMANALRWELPFHRSHQVLQIDAAYAELRSRDVVTGLPLERGGTSWSLAAFHKVPLPGLSGWRQQAGAGFELKGTDQLLLFGGDSFSVGELLLVHAKLGCEWSRVWDGGAASVESSVLVAPGALGGNNRDEVFAAYDPAADASYGIARLAGDASWSMEGDWRLQLRGSAQMADSRILAAEQFAVGGHQTVRGVGERELSADTGWQASVELYGPRMVPFEGWDLRVLGFFDHAGVENLGGSASSLGGAGLGVRMKLAERLDLRWDHGWRLDASEDRSHFGLSVSF